MIGDYGKIWDVYTSSNSNIFNSNKLGNNNSNPESNSSSN